MATAESLDPHANEAAADGGISFSKEITISDSSSFRRDFRAVLAPLEAAAGHALKEPGLGRCLSAFGEDPERFNLLVEDALDRGRNPLALLVRMVTDGDHHDVLPPSNGNARRDGRRGVSAAEVFAQAGVELRYPGCSHGECNKQNRGYCLYVGPTTPEGDFDA